MGFRLLVTYSKNKQPEVGTCTEYTICENISSYTPYDVSCVKDAIISAFDAVKSQMDTNVENIKSIFGQLDVEWGKKFISMNGEDLKIVDSTTFFTYTDNYKEKISLNEADCLRVVESVEEKLTEVKAYIKTIEANNTTYNQLKDERANLLINEANLLSSLSAVQSLNNSLASQNKPIDSFSESRIQSDLADNENRLNEVEQKIRMYEDARIDEPDGSWVLE